MKLNLNDVTAITHGALRVEELENGEFAFYRFTEKQLELYAGIKDFAPKSFATSGVRLELVTDSSSFSFDYHVFTASSRRYYYFDVYVDGVMMMHQGHEDLKDARSTVSVKLPEGTHTVTVYFPCLFCTRIGNVKLDDGSLFVPVARDLKLLCFGDSITQGYDAEFPSQSYPNLLADKLHAEMVNLGIGGEVFRPDLIDATMDYRPDVITVAYGTNDWSGREHDAMVKDANEFYKRLRAAFPTAKIFAITPVWRGDDYRITKVGSFEEGKRIVREAALSQAGIIEIDGAGLLPHITSIYSDKYLHPTDFGFKFYANALYAAMLPHL